MIFENHSYGDIVGSNGAPYIRSLIDQGAVFTNSHAVAHPSEPNYLALFAGTTEGLTDDSCPHSYPDANLGSELLASGQTFIGYSESMPFAGYTGCTNGRYARKHNPWVNFSNLPPSVNQTLAAFPTDYGKLPSVAFVVPDLCNDMHDCSIATGDSWLESRLGPYVAWAKTHDALLIVTFDEDQDNTPTNQILTLFVGPMVQPGSYSTRIDHYSVLRTLQDLYGLAPTANAAATAPITQIWRTSADRPPVVPLVRLGRHPVVVTRP